MYTGIDINAKGDAKVTALLDAVLDRRYEIAKFLIEKGADMIKKGNSGFTPLSMAVYTVPLL
jgi:ankyrin repeat protein